MHYCSISDDPGWEPKCRLPATKSIKLTDHMGNVRVVWLCDHHHADQRTRDGFEEIWQYVEY